MILNYYFDVLKLKIKNIILIYFYKNYLKNQLLSQFQTL
jgi:hypothetical protein